MEEKEQDYMKKVNIDKAKNKTIAAMVLIIFSILTYVVPLMCGEFDFGLCFEVISLIFLFIAKNYMSKYDKNMSKRYIICSMVAIGWILIYDIAYMVFSMQYMAELVLDSYELFFGEILTILYLIMLFKINKDLSKIDSPEKYKESTDWFYEKYDEK